MIRKTRQGLYCEAGDFYIDPRGSVEHAVVTHAHADHARRGSKRYYCATSGADLIRVRLGKKIHVEAHDFGESFSIGGVEISFHPAGHILGSSQVRIAHKGEVWVVSGDYKREFDPTCEPFEVVPCDVFVTEATFGTPSYRWPKDVDLGKEIHEWWQTNRDLGVNSVLFAYSLGKTQRVLGLLEPFAEEPIYCHWSATDLNDVYRRQGIKLARTICLSEISPDQRLEGALILTSHSFFETEMAGVVGENYETAFASGWMAQGASNGFGGGFGARAYDKGFVMSDHADWDDLLQTISETGARRVYVQHRGKGALVRHLRSLGLQAFPEEELAHPLPGQMNLF